MIAFIYLLWQIILSGALSVPENLPAGYIIGQLSTTDDYNNSFIYELIDSAEQRFTIKQGIAGGFWLSTTSKMIDYEERSNYSIIVKATDNGIPALSYQQQIVIRVRI